MNETWVMAVSWKDESKVSEYVGRIDRLAARRAGELELVETFPERTHRVLDLGCGDGRLIDLVLQARPSLTDAVGFDNSVPMISLALQRFAGEPRVRIEERDLAQPLPEMEPFDLVVSGFAIHHLPHDRKRTLFREVVMALRPGGVFVNLEVVACATPELHEEFNRRIGRPGGDPEDILADIGSQLAWMREAGLQQVDCNWRWRGFAVLAGSKPEP